MSTGVNDRPLAQDSPNPIEGETFWFGHDAENRAVGRAATGEEQDYDLGSALRACLESGEQESLIDVIVSVAGSRAESCKILGVFLISMGEAAQSRIDGSMEGAPASARMNFHRFWREAREGRSAKGKRVAVVEAAAANDVAAIGRLLMKQDVNKMRFGTDKQPESLLRRPENCTLLDVAVGSGSVEVTKCLLEFHNARPTRETLKMALSSGNLELIRLLWQRLPGEHENRFDLMEVAADFHREEPLAWLLRDATELEQEAFIALAVERRLADALVIALENGYRAWSRRTLELRAQWPAAATLEVCAVPAGLREDRGWFIGRCGVVGEVDGDGTLLSSIERSDVTQVFLCPGMTEIGRQALQGCSSLIKVVVPSGVRAVLEEAFNGCVHLRRVALPVELVTIGKGAFKGCRRLLTAEIPRGVSTIDEDTFSDCVCLEEMRLPPDVRKIGAGAFKGCRSLRCFVAPAVLTEVGARAFSGCSALRELPILPGVTSIGDGAFESCSGLTSLRFAASVVTIGAGVFRGCSGLAELAIPSGMTTIGACAFDGMSGLRKVVIPSTVTTIGAAAFRDCSGLTQLEIPSTVATIGAGTFLGCSDLTHVELLPGVTAIGDEAFCRCTRLARLTVPAGVVTIGDQAFAKCEGLTELEIPATVTTIGLYFIYECSALRRLTIPSNYQTPGEREVDGFKDVTEVDQLTLLGAVLSPVVVGDLEGCLTSTARVIGSGLAGQRFGRFTIVAA
jgi:hypothetical protein